jgi:hypothetical protein
MNEPSLSFRIAFFPFWRLITSIASLAVGLLLLAARFWLVIPIDIPQIAVSLISAIVSALVLVVVIRNFPVYVHPDGIRCFDAMNRYRLVRWTRIDRLRPFNLLGLRYLRIDSPDIKGALWLPLFLADMDGFREVVTHLAGNNNVLVEWLLEKGY